MSRRVALGLLLGVLLFTAGAFGFARSQTGNSDNSESPPVVGASAPQSIRSAPGATLDQLTIDLQERLKALPNDPVAWATLGFVYIQQAKVLANPDFYPRAEGALSRSMEINGVDNYLAYAGQSALAAAKHQFEEAKRLADLGLVINSYSAILWGALSDAELQLGNYEAAFAAVQRMVDLSPDTASLSRASYVWELRGDIEQARSLMQRAADDAPNANDRAFALFYLGELAFNAGDPNTALEYYLAASEASPNDNAALGGRAKAVAALGQIETALDHYEELVQRAPEPGFIIEYGELLESLGRTSEAEAQYDLFRTVDSLMVANGVEPDAGPAIFYANHGDPERALADMEAVITSRPFVVMQDAYAWALHKNGRTEEAALAIEAAMQLGTPNALFYYHAGMIQFSLGNLAEAEDLLQEALAINPHFSSLDRVTAQQTLDEIADA